MRLSLERKIQLGFGVALAILVAVGAAALRSTAATVESARWVSHTLEVLANLHATMADLGDAEGSARGYVIAGRSSFLQPFESAKVDLEGHVAQLRTLTADNPVPQRRVDSLEFLIAARMGHLLRIIDLRRERGAAVAAREVATGRSKALMDDIRRLVGHMEDEERRLLARHYAALQAKTRVARLAVWGGTLLAFGFVVVASVLIGRELAGRLRAEEALRTTQARLQQVLASSTAVVYATAVTPTGFTPTWVSENVTRMMGYEVAESLEPSWWVDHLHPADRQRVLAQLPDLLSRGQFIAEYRFRHKDRTYRSIRDEARLTRDAVGTASEVVGVWVDITERKRAEEALLESERRLAQLLEALPVGVFVVDAGGKPYYANQKAQEILGKGLVAGGAAKDLPEVYQAYVPGTNEIFPSHQQPIVYALGGERSRTAVMEIRRPDRTVPIEVGAAPVLDREGRVVYAVAAFSDITERERARVEIEQLNAELSHHVTELKAVNQELEAFSYSVSHDLRAPLRSIDGFSQALLEDYASQLDHQGKDYLRRVRAATQRLAELIDDLLGLARVTRAELRTERVDLTTLARSIAAELRQREPEHPVEFVCADGASAQGDPRLLRVVLENLLGNAWKFTVNRPHARIEFGAAENDGRSVYFVRDNGAGFDMAYANKLFGAFQRLHATTEFPGTGIGLATVQRIIHRHGGRVWAEGAVNQGATFYFTLSD